MNNQPSQYPSIQVRQLLWTIGIGNILILLVARIVGKEIVGIPLCLFYYVTDHYCPFCGLTRAYTHISYLEFLAAAQDNIMGLLFCLFAVFIFIHRILVFVNPRYELSVLFWRLSVKSFAVILVVNWFYMLVTK